MSLDIEKKAFLLLLQAGLWEKEVNLSQYNDVDFKSVYNLAQEQSVVGLVAAGLEYLKDYKVPQEDALQFASSTLLLEQRNKAMNAFIKSLFEILGTGNVSAILIKGQGIAQCYERPLWRTCGDIDLLLSEGNYIAAKDILVTISSNVEKEDRKRLHLALTIDSWPVELHGTMKCGLWKRVENELDDICSSVSCKGAVRSWNNAGTQISIPRIDDDVVYVFAHILQHFFKGGIGLRQICDWCRLIYQNKESIDINILEKRLFGMGIMNEWKVFAALAVKYLGATENTIPLYYPNKKYERKADGVMKLVFETGNFGRARDLNYKQQYSFLHRLLVSFWRHNKDSFRQFLIFPEGTIRMWSKMMIQGFSLALKGTD